MINRIEIERLLQSKELKELWQTIQQELPQLHFYEENDSWEEARIDYLEDYISECNTLLRKSNFQEMSIKDLYIYLSSDSLEDEYKQGCKMYDYLHIAENLIDYYLLDKHPEILLEYYKSQEWKEPEQMFKDKMNLYSMCKI